MTSYDGLVSRLRDPEYTGENRCLPCTIVNFLIAACTAVLLGAVFVHWVGILAFVLFAGVIYLRGYLVPGTPTITERYFPARLLELFGKHSPVERSGTVESTALADPVLESGDGIDPLVAAGIVRREGGDVGLTSNFSVDWADRMTALEARGVEAEDVRAAFDADSVSRHGERSFVLDGNRSLRWGSQTALVGDVAAADLLRERSDDWTGLDGDRQRAVLTGLRFCLERCPSCDGPLSRTEDRVDPCCQNPHLVVESACERCGVVVADAAVVERTGSDSIRTRLLRP